MAAREPVALSLLVVGGVAGAVESALEETTEGHIEARLETVPDGEAALEHLAGAAPDGVVVSPPADADAGAAVADLRGATDRPIVAVVEDRAVAAAAVSAGATEYALRNVVAERPGLLATRIREAVDEAFEAGLPGSAGWYDAPLENSVDALTVIAADGTISYQNPSVE